MQAIILAAGMGKRLQRLTEKNAKCMVKVNGVSLIERMLTILDKRKLSKIIIVVGYEKDGLIDFVNSLQLSTPIVYVNNRIYRKTNNIYSLLLAKDYVIKEDTLLLESDIIFEEKVIDLILDDSRSNLVLVDRFASWMDGTCLKLDETDAIEEFLSGKHLNFLEKDKYYKTVNIYKFSRDFSAQIYIPFLEAYYRVMGKDEYYESVIKFIAMLEQPQIKAKRLTGQIWYEIDDAQDLDIAESLFTDSAYQKYDLLTKRYGGYWRYPSLIDFYYLVNPFYPPERMVEEMASNFEVLMRSYPSGMRINALLSSMCFGVKPENILVGNGAAEIIKLLMESFGKENVTGLILPSFDEYRHRVKGKVKVFKSTNEDLSYSAQDIMDFFEDNSVSQIVLINPDNPSGNYISYSEIKKLISWCKKKNIKIIIDESFLDFSDENSELNKTALNDEIINSYKYLYVVKSISKSCGIPGVRMGILVSLDEKMISNLKEDIAIWNINSLCEYYLQIFGKYKTEYIDSLKKVRDARKQLINELKKISYLKVFPSQANFLMCEIDSLKTSARKFVVYLLQRDILVKDLTDKIDNGKQYVRIAVRKEEENIKLIQAMREFELLLCSGER